MPHVLVPDHVFRAYDIRGLAPGELTPDLAEAVGRAYATYLRRRHGAARLVLGSDNRLSSPGLTEALLRGLLASGAEVLRVGLAPSPMLYWAAATLSERWPGGCAGINVTASHNPPAYNGFKLLEPGGMPLLPDAIQELRRLVERGDFESGEGSLDAFDLGAFDPLEDYLAWLAARFPLSRPIRVAVDPGNGVATLTGPEALRRIGARVTGINLELDGTFPAHLPDPQEAAAMTQLSQVVAADGFEIGMAWDGDGDRLGVVDETGRRHTPDAVLALLARQYLAAHPGATVGVDVKVSLSAIDDIVRHGGRAEFSPTGHSLGKYRMRERGIGFGGEASAHYFFHLADPDVYTDDAVYASCLLAAYVARAERPLSEELADLPAYLTSPEVKLPCPDDRKFAVAELVAGRFRDAYPVFDLDGARIDFSGDGEPGWVLVRASNTGPVLSFRVEAATPARYEEVRLRVLRVLQGIPDVQAPDDAAALGTF